MRDNRLLVLVAVCLVAIGSLTGNLWQYKQLQDREQELSEANDELSELRFDVEEMFNVVAKYGDAYSTFVVEAFQRNDGSAYSDRTIGLRFYSPGSRYATEILWHGPISELRRSPEFIPSPVLTKHSSSPVLIQHSLLGAARTEFNGQGYMEVRNNHVYVGNIEGNWRELCQLDMVEINVVGEDALTSGQKYKFWGMTRYVEEGSFWASVPEVGKFEGSTQLCWNVNARPIGFGQ